MDPGLLIGGLNGTRTLNDLVFPGFVVIFLRRLDVHGEMDLRAAAGVLGREGQRVPIAHRWNDVPREPVPVVVGKALSADGTDQW